MNVNLEKDAEQVSLLKAREIENEIINYRNQLKAEQMAYLRTG